MPRLSLYRPQKGNDYKFIDKTVWEMFQVGGTDVFVHKYLGPKITPLWDSAKNYVVGELISINNKVYKAKIPNTGVVPPSINHWEFIREGTPSQPVYTQQSVLNINDLLFLENRDRDYDEDIYVLRGVYSLQDIDFNLSQFGLFLQNDTLFITFHINDTVEKVGRKIISGDVIELPHLLDEHSLGDSQTALKRFYVVEEVTRAAEGYSVTWYPHLYRAKCKPMTAAQEFQDILDDLANPDSFLGGFNPEYQYHPGDIIGYPTADNIKYEAIQTSTGVPPLNQDGTLNTNYWRPADTIGDTATTYDKEMQITAGVIGQAELDSPRSGYDTTQHYRLAQDSDGQVSLITVDSADLDASLEQARDANGNLMWEHDPTTGEDKLDENGDKIPFYYPRTSAVYQSPTYDGPGTGDGDGVPPNGIAFTASISFPVSPSEGQFHLRTDYMPKRLFRFSGTRWIKVEDLTRMTMSNIGYEDAATGGSPSDAYLDKDVRLTQKTTFINNNKVTTINGKQIKEKQSLSQALRPKADE
jgi:hypothetical protein